MAFPQFSEVDEQGHPKQQDAEECLSTILATIQSVHSPQLISDLFEINYTVKYHEQFCMKN